MTSPSHCHVEPTLYTKGGRLLDDAYIRLLPSPYSAHQVTAYLLKIRYPIRGLDPSQFSPTLENLRAIVLLHIIAFPLDNTDLHYTKEHHMEVAPAGMYDRMVLHDKGSYCFGMNGLLHGMLHGLGYRVYAAAARVIAPGPSPSYTPLSHLVLFVQPHPHSTETYVVDVGFGGSGPIRPMLLSDSNEHPDDIVWGSLPPERHRMVRAGYPTSSLETREGSGRAPLRDWHMQVTHTPLRSPETEWTTLYTFSEAEFFQTDIEAASFEVSTRSSLFQSTIVCMRTFEVTIDDIHGLSIFDENQDRELRAAERECAKGTRWTGKWVLGEDGTTVSRRIGDKRFDVQKLESEVARVRVLKDKFHVALEDGDERWIVGKDAALRVSDRGGK